MAESENTWHLAPTMVLRQQMGQRGLSVTRPILVTRDRQHPDGIVYWVPRVEGDPPAALDTICAEMTSRANGNGLPLRFAVAWMAEQIAGAVRAETWEAGNWGQGRFVPRPPPLSQE